MQRIWTANRDFSWTVRGRTSNELSQAAGLFWRSALPFFGLNPTYAPFMTYGPLHLRLGADLVDSAHSESSYQLGSDAMYAMLTRGGYIEPLFPTNLKSCLNTAELGNDVDSSMQVWQPAITAKPITETNSNQVTDAPNYSDQGRNIAAALWPRFTCCNWCAGSYQAAEKHFDVGNGF
jgi:hypothetical protein